MNLVYYITNNNDIEIWRNMSKSFNFGGKKVKKNYFWIISIFLCVIIVGVTMAFFFADEFSSKYVNMSGAVRIQAVGDNDLSIEDDATCNLVITLQDGYDRLIPGAEIHMPANVRVKKSNSSPLLRAKMEMEVFNVTAGVEYGDALNVAVDLYGQLVAIIKTNAWFSHTDGYFYYKGTNPDNGENTLLQEVEVTNADTIVDFIDTNITFPKYVTSDYSGMGVKFIITFQAIQDYIPDDDGHKVDNTLKNSLKIFNEFDSDGLETTPINYFTTETTSGVTSIKVNTNVVYPEVIVLPEKDASGNTITKIDKSFATITNVKRIVVPTGYTTLDTEAFKNSGVEVIDLSRTQITTIPTSCFEGSQIKSVYLPEGLTTISSKAFYNSNLSSITMPSTVTTLSSQCFWDTHLVALYIPANVTSIEFNAIRSHLLNTIVVHEDNMYFHDVEDKMLISNNGNFYTLASTYLNSTFSIPEGVTRLCDYSMCYATGVKILNICSTLETIGTDVWPPNVQEIFVHDLNTSFDIGGPYTPEDF